MLSFIYIFLCLILRIWAQQTTTSIPGCPDINSLSETDKNDVEDDKFEHIKCVCGANTNPESEKKVPGIEVNCVYGASFDDLSEVLDTIAQLNRTVAQINLNYITTASNTTTLHELLKKKSVRQLMGLEIKNCHGGALEVPTIETLELNDLHTLIIESCGLSEIPSSLIGRNTKTISLNGNKIEFIATSHLKRVANSLEFLDLTENLISAIENDAFKQLQKLHTLMLGEHNFANETLLEEIGQIKSLETLDLTRMDGLNGVDQFNFEEDNHIERLVVTGCNLKVINTSSFSVLTRLKELDMRVNLIETLEADSFLGLSSLERMSLAGNFIRDSDVRADRWTSLTNLTQLDLGWNELRQLRNNSFGPELGSNLKILSLRSNEKLTKIENGAFSDLKHLQSLNMSGTSLTKLDENSFYGLDKLEVLDLSNNNLSQIDKQAFQSPSSTLKTLNLASNQLQTLNLDALKILDLDELDLSENPWLCDKNMLKVVEWIKQLYLNAAKMSKTLLLRNAAKTLCDRPYVLQNKTVMSLKPEDAAHEYNKKLDTTTATVTTESTVQESETLNTTTSLIDFSKLIVNIGSDNDTLNVNVDEGKPTYDINKISYGKKATTESNNVWISAIIVIGLLIITVGGVLIVIRNRAKQIESEATEPQEASSTL